MYEPSKDYYLFNDDVLLESDLLTTEELGPYFETAMKAYNTIQDFLGIEPNEQLHIGLENDEWGYLAWFKSGNPWSNTSGSEYNITSLTHEMTHWFFGGYSPYDPSMLNSQPFEEGLCRYIEYLPLLENKDTYSFIQRWDTTDYPDWYSRLMQGENLFDEISHLKNAHDVGILFFYGLEKDHDFDYNKMRELGRSLVVESKELGRPLNAYDIKGLIEEVGGQSIDNLYNALKPGIDFNGYYKN
jgi:hypothetical protein